MRILAAFFALAALASPAAAKEEGWLSASIIAAIEVDDEAALAQQFSIILQEDDAGNRLDAATTLGLLSDCQLDYAQDRVFLSGSAISTGAMLGYRCSNPARGEPIEPGCEDVGYSLVSPAVGDGERSLILRRRTFWSEDRCGPERLPAPMPRNPRGAN